MDKSAVLEKFQKYESWFAKTYSEKEVHPIYEVWTMDSVGEAEVLPNGKESGWPSSSVEYIGWYPNVEDAVDAVLENRCDIWETCYEGAMVICRYPGLYVPGLDVNRQMFKWNMATMQYEPLESEPDIYAHISY